MKKKPLLRSLFLSYIAVLVPVVILCATLFGNCRRVQEQNITQLQHNKAEQFQKSLENELNEVNLILNQVYSDNQKNKFTVRQTFSAKEMELLMNMRTWFAASVRSLDCLDEILFYCDRSGYAVTSHVVLPLETAYLLTTAPEDYWGSYDALAARLEGMSGKRIYPEDGLLYLSCPVGARAGILFSLNQENLLSLYPADDTQQECFALVDKNGTIVFQSGDAFPLDLSAMETGALPESNGKWFVTAQRLDGWNYYVVTALSRSHIDAMLLGQIGWLLVALPLCVLISILLVYRSVNKHYDPIAEILQLANDHGLSSNKNSHEYDQLHQLLRRELDDHESLLEKQALERQRSEDAALLRSLSSSGAVEAIAQAFARKALPFPQANWCFVEVGLLDFAEKDEDTMLSIARLLLSTSLAQDFSAIDLVARHRLIFVVGMEGNVSEKGILLKSNLQRDMNFLREEYSAEFSCAMTEILPRKEDFSAVTAELMAQLAKMRRMPQGNLSSLHVYQALDDDTQQALTRINKMEQDLLRGCYDELNDDLKQLSRLPGVQPAVPEQKKTPANTQIIDQVVALVQSNYYDPNLNISYLAQQVGRHPSVLSKAFRQQMDIGLLDYIHTVRMEAAKKLLVEHPDMTVQRISELCGYVNSDSFQRTFKRITGTTPGKYRDSQQ